MLGSLGLGSGCQAMRSAPELPIRKAVVSPVPRTALLINPFYAKDPLGSYGKHVLTPSLALTTVAASTPEGWSVRLWDENLLQGPPPAEPPPEVAGITVHVAFAERAYALARWLQSRGTRVVLGGLHVLSCPEEALAHCDAIALGDGTQIWPAILDDVAGGCLRRRYSAPFDRPKDAEPVPRRELLAQDGYLTPLSLTATRGCRNRCEFCYLATRGVRMPLRVRSVERVAEEIGCSGHGYAVFLDNNLGADPAYLQALCLALEPLGIIWSAAVTLDVTEDPRLLRAMARSGCTGVFVGLETLTQANLHAVGKRSPGTHDYAERVGRFHDAGIQVNGSFVVGFDEDRPDVFPRMMDWIERTRLECATFHILTPYPGTPLFRQMESEHRLLHRDWSRYDTAHAVFRPRHMSPDTLESGYEYLYRRLNSLRSIWRRRPDESGAVLPYLAMSILYKRANPFWALLIRRGWVHRVWRPLIAWSRWRHRHHRQRLPAITPPSTSTAADSRISPSLDTLPTQ